jgi:DNA-binding NarL/FixJ family response regulator
MKPIRLILADDHAIIREGLRSLLSSIADFELVAEAANGRQAVAAVRAHQPDVALLDISMPLLNGFEATRQILECSPRTKVLILSGHTDSEYIDRMAELGASGYISKHNSEQVLVGAIREIVAGNSFLNPGIDAEVLPFPDHGGSSITWVVTPALALTVREAEVLQLVAEGVPSKQIAALLGITIKTVEKHRHGLMAKLDIHDIAGLTRYAIATGVIEGGVALPFALSLPRRQAAL